MGTGNLGCTATIPAEMLISGGIAAGVTLPLFAYYTYIRLGKSGLCARSAQTCCSPPPLHSVLLYGLLVGCALMLVVAMETGPIKTETLVTSP